MFEWDEDQDFRTSQTLVTINSRVFLRPFRELCVVRDNSVSCPAEKERLIVNLY